MDAEKLPGGLGDNETLKRIILGKAHFKAWDALEGFVMLGTNAAPAIPALSRMMTNNPKPGSQAIYALGSIGEPALPALFKALADTNAPNRDKLTNVVFYMFQRLRYEGSGSKVSWAVPILLKYTKDSNAFVAGTAAMSLGNLHLGANEVVPALTNMLSNPDSLARHDAAFALGDFGDAARPAIPLLQSMTNDPATDVRKVVTNALEKITSSPP